MKHIEQKCTLGPSICDKCNSDSHGDLFTCVTCGASEGELTTDCPGKLLSYDMKDLCYNGAVDFNDGNWKTLRPLSREEDTLFDP